jgi:hypothetical protein
MSAILIKTVKELREMSEQENIERPQSNVSMQSAAAMVFGF